MTDLAAVAARMATHEPLPDMSGDWRNPWAAWEGPWTDPADRVRGRWELDL